MIVGFANGCFDLLHEGHEYFLQLAAKNCDRLVVGLNTDASVRRLKGEGRPLSPYAVRALSLMEWADMVLSFDTEEELETLIQQVGPQIIFKSDEYYITYESPNNVKVIWVPRIPGYSTSEIAKTYSRETT